MQYGGKDQKNVSNESPNIRKRVCLYTITELKEACVQRGPKESFYIVELERLIVATTLHMWRRVNHMLSLYSRPNAVDKLI